MRNIEKKLSQYIDRLNAEKKPQEYENSLDSAEFAELAETVRQVRTLKEPALPGADFSGKIARTVSRKLTGKASVKKTGRAWRTGIAAVAAIIVIAFSISFILPYGKTNIVHAMEQAFQEVKAYHGFLEIVEINAEGKETIQAKREVWADKEGRYYVKETGGSQEGFITVNNGQKKWQLRPDQKQSFIFPAFPDPYRFTFELGKEIEDAKSALEVKEAGTDMVSGRAAAVYEVTPQGGEPYRIWIDRETRLPLQRQSGMQNALQYRVTYTGIDFSDAVPEELIAYHLPEGFRELDQNPEQLVNHMEEAQEMVGFVPREPGEIPAGYKRDSIAVINGMEAVKLNYATQDKKNRVILLQGKAGGTLKPASTAVLGSVGGNTAEIQSPVEGSYGILAGGGLYSGVTDITSIRWQEAGFEYAVVGNAPLEELLLFVEGVTDGPVQLPSGADGPSGQPQIEVPVDLEAERNEQKSADAGHSPWRLDPVYVAQVFASLKISPEGITGEYPVSYEDLKVSVNDGVNAVVEIADEKAPIRKVYLKRLIRQDSTGIWTVVGYDENT